VEDIRQNLKITPLPLVASNGVVLDAIPKSPDPDQTAGSIDPSSDPRARAVIELKFLYECLNHIRRTRRWGELIDQLEQTNARIYDRYDEFWTTLPLEEEVKEWERLHRVPARWKEALLSVARGEDDWQPSIFGPDKGLGPDEFFDWEQPV